MPPHKNTVVWKWAQDCSFTRDLEIRGLANFILTRTDMTHRSPNKRHMREYIVRALARHPDAPARFGFPWPGVLDKAWNSYYQYDWRISHPGYCANDLAKSRGEARRAGRPTFDGAPCSKGHGTLRRTTNGERVVCRKLYNKSWQRQRNSVVEIEVPAMTEDERQIAEMALATTRRR